MEALFTLGRAVRMATGVKVCWMIASTDVAVGVVCALGGQMSEGSTFIAFGVWSTG